jgi:integron integrase
MTTTEAIDRLRKVIRLRHLSLSTEQSYAGWVARFGAWLRRSKFQGTPAAKMEAFLTDLARQEVSASTQNQAFNALLFFYRETLDTDPGKINALRARRPSFVRVAPSPEEVAALLRDVRDVSGYPTRLITHLLYGCGLRVSEPLELRVKDVDLRESRLIIRQAKGAKDRIVPLPCSLVSAIKDQIAAARVIWKRDATNRLPVELPGGLAKKYPQSQFAWQWAWLFPLHTPSTDPRTGTLVRWHCLDSAVQRAVRESARRLGLMITPHHLRHAYATHALRLGANVRDLQDSLGHVSLETTMRYTAPRACAVRSPLENLPLAHALPHTVY